MRSVAARETGAALGLALALATAADAQTLSIVPEQTTYTVGEEVVVRLVADGPPPGGATEIAVFARLDFDAAMLADASVEPTPLTSLGGQIPWRQGAVPCGPGSCDVLNAVGGTITPLEIDPPPDDVWGTVRFTAATPGTVELSLRPAQDYYQGSTTSTYTGFGLNFFDQTEAAPVPITVARSGAIPALDPSAAVVLALLAAAAGAWTLRRAGAPER